jgi:tryptophan synthase alpha chain
MSAVPAQAPTPIARCFAELRSHGQKALIPFLTAGDPDLATTWQALEALDRNGADAIELGVPYSDPLADGPVIQAAATRALARGTTLEAILAGLKALKLKAPIILFIYINPILRMGISPFMEWVKSAGCAGLVVPDLPLEESQMVLDSAAAAGLDVILLVAPTTPTARMQAIAQRSSGFVYLVSTTGVTGMREQMASRVQELLGELRQRTDLPIGVGFGISSPAQARQVTDWGADAAIVGSAFVKRLAQADNPAAGVESVAQLCRELKAALQA